MKKLILSLGLVSGAFANTCFNPYNYDYGITFQDMMAMHQKTYKVAVHNGIERLGNGRYIKVVSQTQKGNKHLVLMYFQDKGKPPLYHRSYFLAEVDCINGKPKTTYYTSIDDGVNPATKNGYKMMCGLKPIFTRDGIGIKGCQVFKHGQGNGLTDFPYKEAEIQSNGLKKISFDYFNQH